MQTREKLVEELEKAIDATIAKWFDAHGSLSELAAHEVVDEALDVVHEPYKMRLEELQQDGDAEL